MHHNYPYLKDSTFLDYFDRMRLKEQYADVTVLDFSEKPLQAIQGRVISGSINLDGNSSIRRTCSLTLLADEFENDLTNVDRIISINKKVDLQIGFLNNTPYYPEYDIIWFPMGIYVITSPSITFGSDGARISLQLKDKMCLLNGECGGVIPSSVTFSEYDTVDETGKYVTLYPTIYQIIQELVNHWGGEQLGKIIISDVDTRIKKVMKWIGSSPLYIITEYSSDGTIQYIPTTNASVAAAADNVKTYEYGSDIGYINTDFIYTGDLIGDAGNSVCDILDKIKDYLGNYEYFYDIEGNFVFQEVKNYLNTSHATVELDKLSKDDYLADYSKGKAVYSFDDSALITSYSNAPQYQMIKNDFVIWGERENADGITIPIRYHLAIDEKPRLGDTYQVFFYTDPDDNLTKAKCPIKYSSKDEFPEVGTAEVFYMDTSDNEIYKWNTDILEYEEVALGLEDYTPTDWRTVLYLQGTCAEPFGKDSNYYYTELKNEWPKLYDLKNKKFYDEVLAYPWDIDFYLDFIDSGAAISTNSISNIGRRTYTEVDDDINCVFEPEIPDLILLNNNDPNLGNLRQECENKGQDYIQLDDSVYSMIAGGGNNNSAYECIRQQLHQYTSYNENINISALPIYYLEPNTRISVRNSESGIYGDYMINTIQIPLDTSSTMTLSCTRALERI